MKRKAINRKSSFLSRWQFTMKCRLRVIVAKIRQHNSLFLGLPLLAACLLIVYLFGENTKAVDRWIEFWGLIFDVAIILVIVEFFRELRDRKNNISRLHDTIQDYKCWNSEEAGHRMGGALRRLGKLGTERFDFSGWKIENFSFSEHGVSSIRKTTFFNATWTDSHKPSVAHLKRIDFSNVDCREVVFSSYELRWMKLPAGLGLTIQDCNFYDTNLNEASFDEAKLVWKVRPLEVQYEIIDEHPDGSPIHTQTEFSPFYGADVSGASFRKVLFKNADFRDVINIEGAFFEGATGLEDCYFDDEETKAAVLEKCKLEIPNNIKPQTAP